VPLPVQVGELSRWLGVMSPEKEKKSVRLNAKRRQILLLHLAGVPPEEISEQVRCTIATVYRTVNSKEGQQVFEDFIRYNDSEFRATRQLAIRAVRDALQPQQDIETRLRAADKVFKAMGDYSDQKQGQAQTAEDVIRRIIEYKSGETSLRMEESRPANSLPQRKDKCQTNSD